MSIALQFWAWAAIFRPLKHVMSMRWLVRLARSRRRSNRDASRVAAIVQYMSASGRFPRRPPANCYERSLAAYRLLGAAGARPELRIGVRRPQGVPRVAAGSGAPPIDGHVWVLLDGQSVAESPTFIEQFTPLLRVDADGRFDTLGSDPERMLERRWTDFHREPTPR